MRHLGDCGAEAGRSAIMAGGAGQFRIPVPEGRRGGRCRGNGVGGACRRMRPHQQPRCCRTPGGARRDRLSRPQVGSVSAVGDRPGRSRHSPGARGLRLQNSGRAHARGGARRRRRLRDEELRLSRICAGAVGGKKARPPGTLGIRTRRGLCQLGARPRFFCPLKTRARQGWPVSRSRSAGRRQHGGVSFDQRADQFHQCRRQRDGWRL